MSDESDNKIFDTAMEELKRVRDELALQMHLAKADAKDEWDKLEKKWQQVQAEAKPLTDVANETVQNVGSALDLAAEELKAGYERLRELL